MKDKELKKKIIAYIENADRKLLHKLREAIENYQKTETVAYTLEGKPLSEKDYLKELEIAENEINSGQFISQEELEKEVENW